MLAVTQGELELEQGVLYWKHEVPSSPPSGDVKPTLLFIHAGVTDHTLWDAQIDHFLSRGWSCLRYDILGYGKSVLKDSQSTTRLPADHMGHIDQLVDHVLPAEPKVIPIGLSMGGSLALGYTVFYPHRVAGAAIIAGGLRGVDIPNLPEEDELFDQADALLEASDVHGYAEMQVRIWGDGPLQQPGRLNKHVRERMMAWNLEIASREVVKQGPSAVEAVRREPAPVTKLHEIEVPVAIAYGTLDETNTTEGMKYASQRIARVESKAFETAHMINLEEEDEFNGWLSSWLCRHFRTTAAD